MNSNIDLTQFGSRGSNSAPARKDGRLVSPPRRIFSRYVLPLLLLTGFGAVAAYSFRSAFVPTVDVFVTMPVPATEQLIAQAELASDDDYQVALPGEPVGGKQGRHAKGAPADSTSSAAPETTTENPPRPGRGKALFQAPGWIEPSPYPILISSLRSGTVERLEVIEGQPVTSGTVVARLINEDQLLAVRAHESTVRLKLARYEAALQQWENPTSLVEAIRVARAKAGQLDAQTRRQQNLIELASLEAKIGTTLTRSGFEASLETMRKETEFNVSKNQLLETRAEVALNSATLHAAEERLRLRIEDREALETASAELDEAKVALDTARLQLDRSVIKAPTDGVIMRLTAAPGSMLSPDMEPGMTVAQMYKPDMLQVRVDVPLAEAAKVRPGLPAEIRVEALPDHRFRGELINIVPEFDLQKNILPVKVRIFDPDQALRPEMIARVEFFADHQIAPASITTSQPSRQPQTASEDSSLATTPTASRAASDDVLMIPANLLRTVGDSRRVLVVGSDNTTQEKIVGRVARAGEMVLIWQGLRISDKVIVTPQQLDSGRAVNIKGIVDNVAN